MNIPINIISTGAGVQSSTLNFMAEKGILPKPTASIFGDTVGEPIKVYEYLEYLKTQISFPLYTVSKGDLKKDSLEIKVSKKTGKRYMKGIIPAFVLNPDGTKGILGRKCTADYKIYEVQKKTKQILGKQVLKEWKSKHKLAYKEWNLSKTEKRSCAFWAWDEMQSDPLVLMWIGISLDEIHRMNESKVPFIKNVFPPRSACKYCPFHSDEEWIDLKLNSPDEFKECVIYERDLQEAARNQDALIGIPFLHESCVPLDQVDFTKKREGYQQLNLFANECTGLCGV
jgi:hypothetical protein